MIIDCIFVGAGGALGAVGRYLLGLLPVKAESGFPYITLGINVIGAFCIGLIIAAAARIPGFDNRMLLFLKVGFCGGFTTFSTFSYETQQLVHGGNYFTGLLYAVLSVVLCVAAVAGAQKLAG